MNTISWASALLQTLILNTTLPPAERPLSTSSQVSQEKGQDANYVPVQLESDPVGIREENKLPPTRSMQAGNKIKLFYLCAFISL